MSRDRMTLDDLAAPLHDLVRWAAGNGSCSRYQSRNPYTIPEVKAAMKALALFHGADDWLDVDTSPIEEQPT